MSNLIQDGAHEEATEVPDRRKQSAESDGEQSGERVSPQPRPAAKGTNREKKIESKRLEYAERTKDAKAQMLLAVRPLAKDLEALNSQIRLNSKSISRKPICPKL